MKYSLTVRPAAERELQQIFTWYEQEEPGTGEEFLVEADRALRYIEERPLSFPVIYRTTRRCVLSGFPYSIFFFLDVGHIFVTACVHQSRDPRVWRSRR